MCGVFLACFCTWVFVKSFLRILGALTSWNADLFGVPSETGGKLETQSNWYVWICEEAVNVCRLYSSCAYSQLSIPGISSDLCPLTSPGVPTRRDYVHRVGRTARAGREGWSLSFVSQYDVQLVSVHTSVHWSSDVSCMFPASSFLLLPSCFHDEEHVKNHRSSPPIGNKFL
jgi:hypothetical protein